MDKIILKYSSETGAKIKSAYTDAAGVDLPLATIETVSFVQRGDVSYLSSVLKTGIRVEIPKGFCGFLKLRSGVVKRFITNGMGFFADIGLIDSDFRGELQFFLSISLPADNIDSAEKLLAKCLSEYPLQLVIFAHNLLHIEESERLTETERGGRGFGSSDSVIIDMNE